MKIALISDLHSSMVPLEAVLSDIERARVDRVICLGDLVDLGPQPREVIARIRELGIECVRGNHDDQRGPPLPPQNVNAWCRRQLGDDDRAFLASLPPSIEVVLPSGNKLLCVHGSPRAYDDEILATTPGDTLEQWWGGRDFHVLAAGHTHLQMMRRHRGRIVINAGSVAQPFMEPFNPKKGRPEILRWSEYAIVEEHSTGDLSVDLRRVNYDFAAYARDVRASAIPDPEGWLATWD